MVLDFSERERCPIGNSINHMIFIPEYQGKNNYPDTASAYKAVNSPSCDIGTISSAPPLTQGDDDDDDDDEVYLTNACFTGTSQNGRRICFSTGAP